MIVLLMGVAGSGKTTVGRLLADALGWPFYDGDAFHPPENVAKMARGEPLTDADRDPWLAALHRLMRDVEAAGSSAVVACSALKHAYRERLRQGTAGVRVVYLKGDEALLRHRLAARRGHFFGPAMLRSQLDALEEPADAVTLSIAPPPEEVASAIRAALGI